MRPRWEKMAAERGVGENFLKKIKVWGITS